MHRAGNVAGGEDARDCRLPRAFDLDQSGDEAGIVELAAELEPRGSVLRLLVGTDPEHANRQLATGAEDNPVGMRAISFNSARWIGNHGDAQISKARAQLAVRLPYAVGQDGQVRAPCAVQVDGLPGPCPGRQQGHRLVTVLPPIAERALEDAFAPVAVHAGDVRQDIPDTRSEDHGARSRRSPSARRHLKLPNLSRHARPPLRPHGHAVIRSQLLVSDAAKLGRRRSVPREKAVRCVRRRIVDPRRYRAGPPLRRPRPSRSAALRPAGPPPTITTSCGHLCSPSIDTIVAILYITARFQRQIALGTTTIPAVQRMQARWRAWRNCLTL